MFLECEKMNENNITRVYSIRENLTLLEIVEHQHTYQQLYKDKDERFNKMYLQLAADKERVSMQKDKFRNYHNTCLYLQIGTSYPCFEGRI